jgi:Zn-finger protein
MQQHWFKNHVAYTMAKYNMSLCVLGMVKDFSQCHVNHAITGLVVVVGRVGKVWDCSECFVVSWTMFLVREASTFV